MVDSGSGYRSCIVQLAAMRSAVVAEESCSGASSDDGGGQTREAKRQGTSFVKCEECREREAKYRCPGCGLRSCGLPCVKSHKERTQCTGKRKRTEFVPVAEFDDNLLISDYNLLEETLRQTDAAKRLRAPLARGQSEIHPSMLTLLRQAKSRSTKVLFLACGMSKRRANTSFYEKKTKRIFWRVEWTFEGLDVQLIDPRVDENLSLESILAKHLNGDWGNVMMKHRLRNFCLKSINEFKLLLPKEPCSAVGKAFHELNLKESVRNQLAHKCIIEYPIIKVVLPGDAGKYIIIPNPKSPAKSREGDDAGGPVTPILHEPEGIPLREEEVEEGEFVP